MKTNFNKDLDKAIESEFNAARLAVDLDDAVYHFAVLKILTEQKENNTPVAY